MFVSCISATVSIFTDHAGLFPVRLTAGNTDLLVIYGYDSNYIHVYSMPTRTRYQIVLKYQCNHDLLVSRGMYIQLQRFDNESSHVLVHYLEDEHVDFQVTPPSVHSMNASERAIYDLKNHFIAIMCGTYPSFNLVLWDQLIPPSSDHAQHLIKVQYESNDIRLLPIIRCL